METASGVCKFAAQLVMESGWHFKRRSAELELTERDIRKEMSTSTTTNSDRLSVTELTKRLELLLEKRCALSAELERELNSSADLLRSTSSETATTTGSKSGSPRDTEIVDFEARNVGQRVPYAQCQRRLKALQDLDRQITKFQDELYRVKSSEQCFASGDDDGAGEQAHLSALLPTLASAPAHLIPDFLRVSWSSGPRVDSSLESCSIVSFNSSMEAGGEQLKTNGDLNSKVEMVYSLLSMLGSQTDRLDSARMLCDLSENRETCLIMRQSGCLSMLVQLLHPSDVFVTAPTDDEMEVFQRSFQAIRNIVLAQNDSRRTRHESRVLRCLEGIRAYCMHVRLVVANMQQFDKRLCADEVSTHMTLLMRFSFDEEHRHITCQLGGVLAISECLSGDQLLFGSEPSAESLNLRRLAGMALTNLTFGDSNNKSLLTGSPRVLQAINAQLSLATEELRQVYASLLRNLSWKADGAGKIALRNSNAVVCLLRSALLPNQTEKTLKSILSALWNMSAHSSENKEEICAFDGALAFLVRTLSFRSPSNCLAVIENGSGILRNVSSHVAVKEEYRAVLRENRCLPAVLSHLRSPSLTVVSNVCGILWNLSARNVEDQNMLWDLGAVPMLRNLMHSKHRMISMGSTAALKNLLSGRPAEVSGNLGLTASRNGGDSLMGTRKMRSLESNIEHAISGGCDGAEVPKNSCQLLASAAGPKVTPNASGTVWRDLAASKPSLDLGSSQQQRMTGKASSPDTRILAYLSDVAHARDMAMSNGHASSPNGTGVRKSRSAQCANFVTALTCNGNPASKEEQVRMDKAATQRVQSNLRRQPLTDVDRQLMPPPTTLPEQLSKKQRIVNDETDSQLSDRPRNFAMEAASSEVSRWSSLNSIKDNLMNTANATAPRMDATPLCVAPPALQQQQQHQRCSVLPPSGGIEPPLGTSVQATPNIVSRRSSLSSENDCEVRSTIESEYSQQPTGQCSPSELPDSPGQTVPPSPTRLKPRTTTAAAPAVAMCNADEQTRTDVDEEVPRNYAQEDSRSGKSSSVSTKLPVLSLSSMAVSLQKNGRTPDIVQKAKPGTPSNSEPASPREVEQQGAADANGALENFIARAMPPAKAKGNGNSTRMPTARRSSGSKTANQALMQDLNELIQLAKPKQRTASGDSKDSAAGGATVPFSHTATSFLAQHRGKAVAIARPMRPRKKRDSATDDDDAVHVYLTDDGNERPTIELVRETAPANAMSNTSLLLHTATAVTAVSLSASDACDPAVLHEHTASVPPITSRSLESNLELPSGEADDKLLQQCIYEAMPKRLKRPDKKIAASSTDTKRPFPPRFHEEQRSKANRALTASKESPKKEAGILEASGMSLVQSADAMSCCLSGSHASGAALDDIRPPNFDDLMLVSGSSAIVQSSMTAERVKDATILMTCEADGTNGNCVEAAVRSKSHATTTKSTDSLSDDNYSYADDDNFVVVPEDFDLDFSHADSGDTQLHNGHLLSGDEELLIDCEPLSMASTLSSLGDLKQSKDVIIGKEKSIRGGAHAQAKQSQQTASPRMQVRTTKTAQLRARRSSKNSDTSESSERLSVTPTGGASSTEARNRSLSPRVSSPLRLELPKENSAGRVYGALAEKKVVSVPPSSAKPAVPPKPKSSAAAAGRSAPVAADYSRKSEPQARAEAAIGGRPKKSVGQNVSSKIAELYKPPSSAASALKEKPALSLSARVLSADDALMKGEDDSGTDSPRLAGTMFASEKPHSDSNDFAAVTKMSKIGKKVLVTAV